jgi:Skp family chaperone for outer membrane proteins
MLMGSTVPAPAAISEALSLINVMLDPQQAKQNLEQLRAEIAKLEQARAAAVEEQKKAATATAEAEKANAALAQRVAELDERDRSISAREQQFETMRSEVRRKIVGMEV